MNRTTSGVTCSMRNRWCLLLALTLISLVVTPASAHHSQSEFDFRLDVAIEGKVTTLEWKSPHARLYVDVTDKNGETVNWNFELPSPNTLMRRGWKRDSLKPGDLVKVTGARARNFPAIAYARTVMDGNGRALFTGVTPIYEPEQGSGKPE
jgi:hypothetical protein